MLPSCDRAGMEGFFMRRTTRLTLGLVLLGAIGAWGCHQETSSEKAAREMNQAVKQAGEAAKHAGEAAKAATEDAMKKTQDAAKQASDAAADAMKGAQNSAAG